MLKKPLKINGRISYERVERFEREMLLVGVQEFCAPEFLIAKQIILRGVPAGERQPLHVVRHAVVVGRWKIQAGMCGCRGNDCGEMRRKFLRRCPLIEPSIGTAPHRHLAMAKWLLRQPFNYVVSVARFVCEWFEFAAGIAAAANIDERKHVTV